jgi:hypothetical protein
MRTDGCKGPRRLWEVILDQYEAKATRYFLVEQTGKWSFLMRDVRGSPFADCTEDGPEPSKTEPTMFEKALVW